MTPVFADRVEAGRLLGERLRGLVPESPVVLGLPRGGMPVGREVAEALGAPLDVIVVRKLGVPTRPELAMGAIGEGGVRVVDEQVVRGFGVTAEQLDQVERQERAELERRLGRYRGARSRTPLEGRVALVVDDGIATGSTARAACLVARGHGAARVVLAVPVAPLGWEAAIGPAADAHVCLATPEPFGAVGRWYVDFRPTSDAEVEACLRGPADGDLRP